MAETVKESANREHNRGSLLAQRQVAHREILALERQIEALKETHIKPLQKQISKKKKNVCTDEGCNIKQFNAWHTIFRQQEDAKQFEDEGARDKVLDGIRIGYEALSEGEMLDFVSVLTGDGAPERSTPAPASRTVLSADGYQTYLDLCKQHETGEALVLMQVRGKWVAYSAVAMMSPRLVVYEAALPQAMKSVDVARRIWGLCAMTEEACHRQGVEILEQNLSSIRSHFLSGQRHGKKSDEKKKIVMSECLRRGFDPKTTDESDALAILDYTACTLRHRFEEKGAA